MIDPTAGLHLETDRQLLSGCREDSLRKVNGARKVARRMIVVGANALLEKNLSLPLAQNPISATPLNRRPPETEIVGVKLLDTQSDGIHVSFTIRRDWGVARSS